MMWFLRFMVILSVPFTAMYAQALTRADQLIVLGGTSSASGSSTPACTNNLVLDYSNSCALIAQAWGQ